MPGQMCIRDRENKEKAIDYCVDMNDENGSSMDRETTAKYLEADTYYTLYEACGMLNDKEEGCLLYTSRCV